MAQALEAGDDPLAEFLAWHARQLERDNAEGRGPVLVEWPKKATAAGWPDGKEVPV